MIEVVDVEDALVDRWHSSVDIILFEEDTGWHIVELLSVLELERELEVEVEVMKIVFVEEVLIDRWHSSKVVKVCRDSQLKGTGWSILELVTVQDVGEVNIVGDDTSRMFEQTLTGISVFL